MRFSRLPIVLAATIVLAAGSFGQEALATRLSAEFKQCILKDFPTAKIRLDGSIETVQGDLYLPFLPGGINVPKWGKTAPEYAFPNKENPDVIVYNNGWIYLRVIKEGAKKTVVSLKALPEKISKQIIGSKLPADLIVPESFTLPKAMKPAIGELDIKLTDDIKMVVIDQSTGHEVKPKPAQSDKGMVLVTSLRTGTLILLDEHTLNKITEFPTEGTLNQLTVVGKKVYIADQAKNRVLILDPEKKEFLGQIDLPPKSAPKGICALPNGQLIYVSESGAGDVAVIETSTMKVLLRTKVPPGPGRLAITPDGHFLLVSCVPSAQVCMISTMNQAVVGTIKVGAIPTSIVISRDGHHIYVSNRGSNSVSIIDTPKKEVVATIPCGNAPTGLCLSHDDSKLFVACARDNSISVFDTKTHQKIGEDIRLPLDIEFPGHLHLTQDGKKILVTSESSDTMGVLDVEKLTFDMQPRIGHTSHDVLWVPL